MKNLLILFVILVLGASVRFWDLAKFPISLNWDEVSLGYNGYSILLTGKDEWGTKLPLIFKAFGDFKLPVYVYSTVGSISLFGLTPFAVRFPSVIAGIVAILGIFLLARELSFFKSDRISPLVAAFILAFMPWHFFISRPALEANLSLSLTIFGLYFLVRSLQRSFNAITSALFFGLALHTYNTSRVYIPLLLLTFVVIYFKKIKIDKFIVGSVITLFIFIAPILMQVITGSGLARYSKLAILNESTIYQIGEARRNSSLPPLIAKFVHNKPIFFVNETLKNYISYFSLDFFNQSRGSQSQFAIPNHSLLGLPILMLFIIGIFKMFRLLSLPDGRFVVAILLLAPIAASLTYDPPQALRPTPMIIGITLIASVGFKLLYSLLGKFRVVLIGLVIFTVFVNFYKFTNDYRTNYTTEYASSWQYGYEQVLSLMHRHQADKYFVTKKLGEPHIFYAFYERINPSILQDETRSVRFEKSAWYWTDKIDNFYFINDWQIPNGSHVTNLPLESGQQIPCAGSILITTPQKVPLNFQLLETVYDLKGNPYLLIGRL